ncbi:GNAT family N-acetyltransferase [Paenibacillus wenxiniae]|uniref:GNAT family N-acetyltransferase n=1 Tax=Paenibacillus wenxiniae TaxID=1636843 RepID=A0ABW4RIC2_9BACL
MSFTFIPSTSEQLAYELAIINSNPRYNLLSKGKERITESELQAEHTEAAQLGAERRLICLDGVPIGIVEWLPLYPLDGYPWLGLFMIDGRKHRSGYGALALKALEEHLLLQLHIRELRLVVLVDNEPAHQFWKKQQFRYVKPTVTHEGLDAIIYEKQL